MVPSEAEPEQSAENGTDDAKLDLEIDRKIPVVDPLRGDGKQRRCNQDDGGNQSQRVSPECQGEKDSDHGEAQMYGEAPYHRVLDYLSLQPKAKITTRGLVNANTIEVDALASALFKMPVKEYDDSSLPSSQAPLDWNEALDVAGEIVDSGPYTNLSDLALVDWPFVSTNILSGTWRTREISKEAVIRNTADLLTTRQNLFIVLLAGGPFSRGVGIVARQGKMGDWLGTQRAVAVLWRDPIPDPDSGRCPVALVYFKWLED